MNYVNRLIKPPKESFFLFGPRGVGKSTWLAHVYPNSLRLDLLDQEMERRFLAKPERLIDYVSTLNTGDICIIDEVQRVPNLIPVIHMLIEQKRGVQFILTASSSRKLKRTLGNLLGGRALLRYMHPFMAFELKEAFSLPAALKYGLIPMVWESLDRKEKIKVSVSTYLKEEVQAEGLVRQIEGFARFMEIATFSHGSLWVSTEIARESQIKRQTVDNYVQILEDLLLAFKIPVFTRRAKRDLISHSKFYFFDVGVFRELRPTGPMDKEAELEGPALEGLVAQHLQAWVLAQSDTYKLYFWRTRTQIEVDFVIYGLKGFWAIEVKRGREVFKEDIKSLLIFKEEYPESVPILLYGGQIEQNIEGVHCIPIEKFLLALNPDQLILE